MGRELVEIDTKGMCLLCYDPGLKTECEESLISTRSSLTGFKQLLRYLNVSTKELFNCSSEFLQWMEIRNEIDVQISMCPKCSLVTEQFDVLYQQYELIQFQFDKCVASLHQSMKRGDESIERVRDFKMQMRPNKSADLINASIACNLRNQTFKKCSLKLKNSFPRVTVHKLNCEVKMPLNITQRILITTNHPYDDDLENNLNTPTSPQSTINDNDTIETTIPCVPFITPNNEAKSDDNQTFESHSLGLTDDQEEMEEENEIANGSGITTTTSNKNEEGFKWKTTRILCEICKIKAFNQKKDLRRHIYCTHPEHVISKYCSPGLSIDALKTSSDHVLEQVHVECFRTLGFQCCYCQQELNRKDGLIYHIFSHHLDRIVAEVNRQMSDPSSYTLQLPVAAPSYEKCEECSKTFASKQQLNTHMRTHTYSSGTSETKVYMCQHCGYNTTHPHHFKYHQQEKHTIEHLIPCLSSDTCRVKCQLALDTIFKGYLKLDGHCPKCECKVTQNYSLRRHMLQQHYDDFVKDVKVHLGQVGKEVDVKGGLEEMEVAL